MNIILIGMMGSGKSAIGRLIADKLGMEFVDTDSVIEKCENAAISAIFDVKGESYFRDIEKKTIREITQKDGRIIATGGGAPCFDENWDSFRKNGLVVWLRAKPDVLYARISNAPAGTRPLLKGNLFTLERITDMLGKRETFYGRAHFIIETDGLTENETAEKILCFAAKRKI